MEGQISQAIRNILDPGDVPDDQVDDFVAYCANDFGQWVSDNIKSWNSRNEVIEKYESVCCSKCGAILGIRERREKFVCVTCGELQFRKCCSCGKDATWRDDCDNPHFYCTDCAMKKQDEIEDKIKTENVRPFGADTAEWLMEMRETLGLEKEYPYAIQESEDEDEQE